MAETRWVRTPGLTFGWTPSGELTAHVPGQPDGVRVESYAVGLLDLFTHESEITKTVEDFVDAYSTEETREVLAAEVGELVKSWQRSGLLIPAGSGATHTHPADLVASRVQDRTDQLPAHRLIVSREFFNQADELRAVFEARTEDLELRDPALFAWHNRYLPGRSAYSCTRFDSYFPAPLVEAFVRRLAQWGLENLGCQAMTPLFLYCYTDGCRLALHADGSFGPWGFVYSLTRLERAAFYGGETLLMRSEALDYWRRFEFMKSTGPEALLERIEPVFNQLIAFDARIPHGVNEVAGSRYPVDGRLVVAGWFKEPELYGSEGLGGGEAFARLQSLASDTRRRLGVIDGVTGLLTLRLTFGTGGRVEDTTVLSNTLIATHADSREPERLLEGVKELLLGTDVQGASERDWAILPLRLPSSGPP